MVAPQCFITCIIILMIMFLDRVITGVECDRDAPRIELGISHPLLLHPPSGALSLLV